MHYDVESLNHSLYFPIGNTVIKPRSRFSVMLINDISSTWCTRKKSLKIPKVYSDSVNGEELTTQWPKEKVQKDKQRSTKHTHRTTDRVTRTPL